MKNKYTILILIFLLDIVQITIAQEATIKKMMYLEANSNVNVLNKFKIYPDNTFSFFIKSNHFTSPILMNDTCPEYYDNGNTARIIEMKFDSEFNGIISQQCMPRDSNYTHPTGAAELKFEVPIGGFIYVGRDEPYSIIAERRDAQGNKLWQKHYGGSGADYLIDALGTPSGNVIILSETFSHNGDVPPHPGMISAWTFCIDTTGNIIWSNVLQGSSIESPYNLIQASNEGCYVVGHSNSKDYDFSSNKGGTDLFLARLDSLGKTIWVQTFGGSGSDNNGSASLVGCQGVMGFDNHIYITGMTSSIDKQITYRSNIDQRHPLLLKADTNGNLVWLKTYNTGTWGSGVVALSQSPKGNIWVGMEIVGGGDTHIGKTKLGDSLLIQYIYGGSRDTWVFQTDEHGTFINGVTIGSSSNFDLVSTVHALNDGSVVVGGHFRRGNGKERSLNFPLIHRFYDNLLRPNGPIHSYIAHIGSVTTSVHDLHLPQISVDIYPNPVSNTLHVNLQKQKTCQVQIINNLGQIVYQSKINEQHTINTSQWPAGNYTVILSAEQHSTYYYQIAK